MSRASKLVGFLVGNFIGTVSDSRCGTLGSFLGWRTVRDRAGSIPIIALAPIIIIWFGTGLISKVAMSTLSVVIVALVTSYKRGGRG